ncbi:MAG TPA: nicotinate-nucleotide adenylyltransferase [Alcanivoracaceae bacterium]|nr:nicotinate-nucleotide adenylyltransferase [Alcanivoracaceae bacterium]
MITSSRPQLTPLALFGGTFDPVHKAHLQVALTVADTLHCPVTLLPNAAPPHKDSPNTSAAHRLAMLELACAPFPQLNVSDWELQQPGPSWTLNTLRHWREKHPQAALIWVIGGDSFAQLHRWHEWEQYASLCHLAILPRPQGATAHPNVLAAFPSATADVVMREQSGRRIHLAMPSMDISSTRIREELATQQYSELLPNSVMAYITSHGLYGVAKQ